MGSRTFDCYYGREGVYDICVLLRIYHQIGSDFDPRMYDLTPNLRQNVWKILFMYILQKKKLT